MLITEIAEYLQFMNLGVYDPIGNNGDIFIYTMPSSPDNIIALYERGGGLADGKLGYDPRSVEIIVRGRQAIPTHDKAQYIYNTLHGFHNKTFIEDGIWVVNCLGDQAGPNYISKDENKRFEFSLNFTIEIKNFAVRNNGCK